MSEIAEIFGHFRGSIDAEVLRFGSEAVASGTFRARRLMMMEGATVDGSFNLDAGARIPTSGKGEAQSKAESSATSAARAPEHTTA